MSGYVLPEILRGFRFVPRQPGRRSPARVTSGAFAAAGADLPADPRLWNEYQLSGRQGWAWTPALDQRIGRCGGELLGHGALVLADIDVPASVDGSPMVDSLRWLCDRAVESGEFLDLSTMLTVKTPGHPDSGHLPGWHIWYAAPEEPVRMGPLERCKSVELRSRGTCPGSPGYLVQNEPDDLPPLPRWICQLAGAPRTATAGSCGGRGHAAERLEGILAALTDAGPGDGRNALLYWSACRLGELAAAGDLAVETAEQVLYRAAELNGHCAKHGSAATFATIRSGLRTVVAA